MATVLQRPAASADILRRAALAQRIVDLAIKAERPDFKLHDAARNAAEAGYKHVVNRFVSAAEMDVVRKKKAEEELLTLWLMMIEEEEEEATERAFSALGGKGRDIQAAKGFAKERQGLLQDFPLRVVTQLQEAFKQGGPKAVRTLGRQLEAQEGGRLAATEAQATYGHAQLRVLEQQGYTTKRWVTMADERVRSSHNHCEEQGEIPLLQTFHNGLRYPGDPNGGPEEVCNCRCWLVGGRK